MVAPLLGRKGLLLIHCLRGSRSLPPISQLSSSVASFAMAPTSAPSGPPLRFEIEKSEQDDRVYRGLQLDNGMKVLLVSDPKTDKAGAALDVNVGHMVDPVELPGLAHFCEHMLFLGTEKYPDENEYSKFLSQHGGSSNAYTSSDHTNYYFDVSPKHLKGALDRFSQFFIEPLFTESATDREVKAVNSEHEKNIPTDSWRIKQLEHSLSDPDHDYYKFGTGNSETLDVVPKSKGINVRDELLKFHNQWYSSNIMALSVLGNQPLDELEEMIRGFFSAVKNKNVEVPSWDKHPFREQENRTITYVVPVKDIRHLNITFPIPDLHPYYKTGPGHYLGHMVAHEGKGSLLSELKARSWASSLVGGQKQGSKGFSFFVVNVDLSEEGMNHILDIVGLVFQYLRMLRETGPLEWVFEECKNINSMHFRFKDKERPQGYVCNTSSNIHDYPMPEVLTGGYLLSEWRPDLINMVLEKLIPENVRVTVIAKKFADIATETERWYGTKYKSERLSDEQLKTWTETPVHESLAIPPKNEFIPTNFDLVPRLEKTTSFPQIVRETPLSRLWYKLDDEFLLPKACLNFEFMSPCAYMDPHSANLTAVFARLFKDDLNEYVYDAELAGLGYSLSNTKHGFNLSIRGFNEKQRVLLDKIVTRMANFEVNEHRFKVLRETYERELRNFQMGQPHHHAAYYNMVLLADKAWEMSQLLEALPFLTAEEMQNFVPRLLSSLHIEGLVHGNMTEQEALDILKGLEEILQSRRSIKTLVGAQLIKDREVQLTPGHSYLYRATNDVHKSSCIEIYYQTGLQSTRSNMLIDLFSQIINEPCFNVLRTQEQLGYIVFSGVRRSCGAQGIRVIVQSERHPVYLNGRIEAFLASMESFIEEMSEEEFEKNKSALEDKRLEKPKKLSSRTAKFWGEIVSRHYNFDRDNIEVEELRQITKKDVLDFYHEFLANKGPSRRKLSCHVVSTIKAGALEDDSEKGKETEEATEEKDDPTIDDEQAEVIETASEFRAWQPLYPVVKPFTNPKTLKK